MTEPTFTSDITVRLVQKVGGDHMVVAAAKVSVSGEEAIKFSAADQNEASFGLINYLMKHRHGTPFEHASISMFVHAPVFVWWEWVRHRIGISFNLESSRYKKLEPVFWIPSRTRAMRPTTEHKPARPRFERVTFEEYEAECQRTMEVCTFAYQKYEESLAAGICSEVARDKLPFSIYFSGWVTCNPRSLMHFLSLRTHDPTARFPSFPQAEIEEAARAAELILAEGWPLTYRAWCDNGRVAP